MLICSLYFASIFCFQQPIICNPIKYEKAIFTAYTLSEDETDDSPNIGAWGDDLSKYGKECVVATRLYPRNTVIYIKSLQWRCKVLDKIGERFAKTRIDILMKTKKEALNFGKQTLEYTIVP